MGEFIYKYKFLITGLIIVLIVGLVGYSIFVITSRSGKVAVDVTIVPSDALVKINNQTLSSGTSYLKPGNYKVSATKNGFADFSSNVTVSNASNIIVIPLTPVSYEAKKWAQDNQASYMVLETKAGQARIKQGQAFTNKNPITSRLPFENFLFKIGYMADPADKSGSSVIIVIDATEGYRNAAIQKINDLGYNPADYKIMFRNYTNPFSS